MRAFSSALKAGLASEVTTLGWLMMITRRDGTVIRLNTLGADYTFGGESFKAYPGFVMGSAQFTDSLQAASLAQGSASDSIGPILFTDAVSGLYSGAAVRLFLVDWTTGEGGEIGFKWEVGTIAVKDSGETSFDIWSALRTNHSLFLKRYGPGCTADLFDARCGVDVAAWEDSVTVASYVSAFTFTISGARPAAVDGWYQDGAIAFDDGENAGFAYDIRTWVDSTNTVTLRQPLRRPLVPGVAARIHPGCDKTTGPNGCGRFANYARFQGFAHLPGDETQWGVDIEPQPAATVPETAPIYHWSTGTWY